MKVSILLVQLGSTLPLCDDTLLPLLFICSRGLMGLQPPLWPESCAWRSWHFSFYPLTARMSCLEAESRLANTSTDFFFYIKKFGGWVPRWFTGKESACHCRKHKFDPWSGRSHMPRNSSMCHSYWACALEPGSHNCWDRRAREPVLHSKRSHHNGSPCTATRE